MKRATLFLLPILLLAQQPVSREQRGAPVVDVMHSGAMWKIAGRKTRVTLNERDLAISVEAGGTTWKMTPSLADDMLVKSRGQEFPLRFTDATRIHIEPLDTGFKTGVKISLDQFRHATPLDLRLYLTVAIEGGDEDLVFDIAAAEGETVLRQLDWPKQMDASDPIDFTVLSNRWGTLLPRNWPKAYNPIREGDPKDVSVVESNLIECWSMSWWGFEKGSHAMMIIVETPDDASYKFSHPAGGPTVIGPRWRATLGRFGYPRTARMIFLGSGNYVTMAKRYRKYVMDTGQFVSLKDKIAHDPKVADLIGTPHIRLHTFTNYRPGGYRYDKAHPERNVHVVTFDQRAEQLRELKARGVDRLYVCLAGGPYRGYDRQHPDELPPAPEAGGWDGLKRFSDAMRELNYVWTLHDQYRDYYTDSPSWQPQFAVHEESAATPPMMFPGTRFGQFKEGPIPMMDHWDGGAMGYLSPRMELGHLEKNWRLILAHGARPTGAYLDVFGYVPPDEDFNPEHPATRADSMRARALCMRWVRNNVGLVGTEAASDWVIPYADFGSANPGQGLAIPVPLYQLVYHDAIVIPQDSGSAKARMVAMLYGGAPSLPGAGDVSDETLAQIRRMAELHARVGMLEMTSHEFLDANYRKERTTFADGTTVTADFDAGTVEVKPDLDVEAPGPHQRAAWMRQAGWGVMTHYLADWQARVNHLTMTIQQWNKMVDGFDVEKMADQLQAVGAHYYQISIGQNSGYYLAPNGTYDRLTGIQASKCSRRDLVADLYEPLHKRGIRLMVYLPSGAPGQDKAADAALGWRNGPYPNKEFQIKWEQVIREWSLRWGRKVDGWWFDGCYWPDTMYRSPDPPNFASFAAAARAGNPDAAVAFNPGVVYRILSITPYEDFTAGEIDKPELVMIRRAADGRIDGTEIQMLSYLGQTWGMGDPRFTTEQVIAFTRKIRAAGGAVTWDVPVAIDGTIAPAFLDQLKALAGQ